MNLKQTPITKLEPYPRNPRLFLRENVVAGIAAQIKERGKFEECHALLVRPLDSGKHQIISGHQRFEAAKRAGLKEVPCFVVEMTDEEAFREVLLSNAQSDLTPLEIGLHVLSVVGKGKPGRGNKGGIADWARNMGISQQLLQVYVSAAAVAKSTNQFVDLIPYMTNLSILHRCPESDWPDLIGRMLSGHWTQDQTERYISVIKELEMPEDLADIFPRPVLIARFFEKREFSQSTLERVVKAIRATEGGIRAYGDVIDAEAEVEAFHAYLAAHAQEMLDPRDVMKWQRTWTSAVEEKQAEHEQRHRWNEGDWRAHLNTLSDNSITLVLTDPPYGIDYQSGRAVAGKGYDKIENDGRDETITEISSCFQALFPKLKDDAHVLCFCHSYWSNESALCETLISCGYQVCETLVWIKDMQGPGDLNGFAPKYEHIVHAVKGSPTLWRRDSNVLEHPRVTKSIHPAEKPVALLRQLIEVTTVEGDLVADPFAGVASTLIAAKESKRFYWGCEIVPEFFQVGASRLNALVEVAA